MDKLHCYYMLWRNEEKYELINYLWNFYTFHLRKTISVIRIPSQMEFMFLRFNLNIEILLTKISGCFTNFLGISPQISWGGVVQILHKHRLHASSMVWKNKVNARPPPCPTSVWLSSWQHEDPDLWPHIHHSLEKWRKRRRKQKVRNLDSQSGMLLTLYLTYYEGLKVAVNSKSHQGHCFSHEPHSHTQPRNPHKRKLVKDDYQAHIWRQCVLCDQLKCQNSL